MKKETEKINKVICNLLNISPKSRKKRKKPEAEENIVEEPPPSQPSPEAIEYKTKFEILSEEFHRIQGKLKEAYDQNDELEEKVFELEKKLKFNEGYIRLLKDGKEE